MSLLPSWRTSRDFGQGTQSSTKTSPLDLEKMSEFSWFRRNFEFSDLLIEKVPGQEGRFLFSLKLKGAGVLNSGTLQNPAQRLLLLSFKGEAKELALLSGLISREVLIEEELLEGSLKVQDLETELQQLREEVLRLRHENQVLKQSLVDLSREPRVA